MHARVSGLDFVIKADNENSTKKLFGEYSAFDLSYSEGISELYSGILKVYSNKVISADKMVDLIGKTIYITASVTDELKKDSDISSVPYAFKRHINASISNINFLGESFVITVDNKLEQIYQYDILFVSPLDTLNVKSNKYRDETVGELLPKLKTLMSEPVKAVFGNDGKIAEELGVKFEILDEDNLRKVVPKNVTLQVGTDSPMTLVRKIMLGYGLNYAFVHSADESKPKLYISKGYGVMKGSSVESSYFSSALANALNFDENAVILCDKNSSATPKLNSISVAVSRNKMQASEIVSSLDNMLIFGKANDLSSETEEADSALKKQSNVNDKLSREYCRYNISASHIIYCAGSTLKVKGYLADDTQLLVDRVSLHLVNSLSAYFGTEHQMNPSVQVSMSAYAIKKDSPAGSFVNLANEGYISSSNGVADSLVPIKTEANIVTNEKNLALFVENKNDARSAVQVIEALVCDGDGNVDGEWDSTTHEPRIGSICLCHGDDVMRPSSFYALPSNSTTPVIVRLTSTQGDAFNFPKIGQKILLLASANSYYLHSFLAQKDSTQVTANTLNDRNSALASVKVLASSGHGYRVHSWNAVDKSKNVGIKGYNAADAKANGFLDNSSITLEKNQDNKEYVKNQILKGSESGIVATMNSLNNTEKYSQDYNVEKQMDEKYRQGLSQADHPSIFEAKSLSKRCEKVREANTKATEDNISLKNKIEGLKSEVGALTKLAAAAKAADPKSDSVKVYENQIKDKNNQLDKLNKDLEASNKKLCNVKEELYAVTDEFIDRIGIPEGQQTSIVDLLRIDHKGNLEINVPNGTITLNAKKITLENQDGISMSGTGNISLNTTKSVKMGTRGTSLSVSPSAIALSSNPFASGALSGFGSKVVLSSFTGIKMIAPKISGVAKFSASLGDSLGGKVGTSKGVASIKGGAVSMATLGSTDYYSNIFTFDKDLTVELVSSIEKAVNNTDYFTGVFDGILYPAVMSQYGFWSANGTIQGYFGKEDITKNRKDGKVKTFKDNLARDKANGKSTRGTIATFVADTCDFACDCIDYLSDSLSVIIAVFNFSDTVNKREGDDEVNWFSKSGLVGKNHAEDLKYLFSSINYTLNTIAVHAVYLANSNWSLLDGAKIGISAGKITQSSYSSEEKTLNRTRYIAP